MITQFRLGLHGPPEGCRGLLDVCLAWLRQKVNMPIPDDEVLWEFIPVRDQAIRPAQYIEIAALH